jgi:hypothetical protein
MKPALAGRLRHLDQTFPLAQLFDIPADRRPRPRSGGTLAAELYSSRLETGWRLSARVPETKLETGRRLSARVPETKESPKKKPARWGRAGFVLLGRRCCYEVRRTEKNGART